MAGVLWWASRQTWPSASFMNAAKASWNDGNRQLGGCVRKRRGMPKMGVATTAYISVCVRCTVRAARRGDRRCVAACCANAYLAPCRVAGVGRESIDSTASVQLMQGADRQHAETAVLAVPDLVAWPPGADSLGSWLRCALGTSHRAAQGPVGPAVRLWSPTNVTDAAAFWSAQHGHLRCSRS